MSLGRRFRRRPSADPIISDILTPARRRSDLAACGVAVRADRH